MLLIEGKNIKKQIGDRTLFEIEDLKLYEDDRIGIVGKNGSGKTTLVRVLLGLDNEVSGSINLNANIAYIPQIDINQNSTLSGGEWVKKKLDKAFSKQVNLLIADEPTCNLDMDSVKYLENKLLCFKGGILIISHDRVLLNLVCTKILEIDLGKVHLYHGNYCDYEESKEKRFKNQKLEYEKYIKERNRLQEAAINIEKRANNIKKTPSRMGNSEARLHKREAGESRAKIEGSKKIIQGRIEKLEKVNKVFDTKEVKIYVPSNLSIHSKMLIEGEGINKCFGEKIIFENADFKVENNKRTVLLGTNGSGKTTLLNMICTENESIKLAKGLKIGYFKQNLNNLEYSLTVMENVISTTSRKEFEVRQILAHFLFKQEDVYKKVEVLSGGERIKASFAKVFLSDVNLLILDEPTNYLDGITRESLENALLSYQGAVVIVSHDRAFVSKVADNILYIEKHKIHTYYGDFDAFSQRHDHEMKKPEKSEELMVLENRMNFLIGRLSLPNKGESIELLEQEYQKVLAEIKHMKNF